MRLRVATWNINSVRLRAEQVARFTAEQAPDVVCLQEIKCREGEFPREALAAAGLPHVRIAGQKGWHGVAIASRLPLDAGPPVDFCREGHARCVTASVKGVSIVNLYIPAGGDTPDPETNPKFAHKLDFYDRLIRWTSRRDPRSPLLLAGDFNIAPGEHDVWNHRHMLKVVSHTPVEIETAERLRASLDFTDLARACTPASEKLFSWWSYRAQDHRVSNRGLRLDHLWASPGLRDAMHRAGPLHCRTHADVRSWTQPSDHVPVVADLIV